MPWIKTPLDIQWFGHDEKEAGLGKVVWAKAKRCPSSRNLMANSVVAPNRGHAAVLSKFVVK